MNAKTAKNRAIRSIADTSNDLKDPSELVAEEPQVDGYVLLFERMIEQSKEDSVKLRTKTPKGLEARNNIKDIANAKRFLYKAANMLGVNKKEIDLLIQKLEAEREAKYGKDW